MDAVDIFHEYSVVTVERYEVFYGGGLVIAHFEGLRKVGVAVHS